MTVLLTDGTIGKLVSVNCNEKEEITICVKLVDENGNFTHKVGTLKEVIEE